MAPPSPRRPGFSRRAQYGIFVSYVIAVAGAALALLLALTARFDPQGHAAMQSVLSDITAPVSSAGRSILAGTGDFGEGVAAYFDAASKNKAMAEELKAARQRLIKGEADARENLRLKKLLGLIEAGVQPVATGRLIASTGASSRRYATLSAGANLGVANGQPVRTSEGLVGRIVQVGRVSSRVLLIVDGGNIVPVKRLKDDVPALAVGLGNGRLELKPLAAASNPFRVGDIFITSGSGGIYPPGVPVAVAMSRTREGAIGKPMAEPAAFDYAVVEPVYVQQPPPMPEDAP